MAKPEEIQQQVLGGDDQKGESSRPIHALSSAEVLLSAFTKTMTESSEDRERIQSAQGSSTADIRRAVDTLKILNAASDQVYQLCSAAWPQHLQLLATLKKELTKLEARVHQCRTRAEKIAQHDGVDVSSLVAKSDPEDDG